MNIDTIRAWKDRSYHTSLSLAEQALLPENPVGSVELSDEELKAVSGGQARTNCSRTLGGLTCQTQPDFGCPSQAGPGPCMSGPNATCGGPTLSGGTGCGRSTLSGGAGCVGPSLNGGAGCQ